MSDYHVHLYPHGSQPHGDLGRRGYLAEQIEAYLETAHTQGVSEVGFTEHFYRFVESEPILGDWWQADRREDLREATAAYVRAERIYSLESYVQEVVHAKDRGLPVKLGLEVDFFVDTAEAVAEFLADYPFDYLLASTHWIGAWSIGVGDQEQEYERRGHRQAYEDYFAIESELASSGYFDVLAHADFIKMSGVRLETPPADLYRNLATAASRTGVSVDVSTAGLYQPAAEMYPSQALLQEFFNHGVPITLSSDAHTPDTCGRDHSVAVDFARSVGYTERMEFTDRVGKLVPL